MSTTSSSYKKYSFRDLAVWQQGYALAKGTHALAQAVPAEKSSVLMEELSRVALEIPMLIAKGQQMFGKGEFVKHLREARNNTVQCETVLLLVQEIYPDQERAVTQLREINTVIQKMLSALIYTIEHGKSKKQEQAEENATSSEPVRVPVAA